MSEFINGFEVDKYNQYDLPINVKTSTCPLCSAERKKARDKCLSLNWETGLGHCHHCGETIQMHTYKKKKETKPYKRPSFQNNTTLSNNLVKWFEGRKITQFTLRRLKIGEGKEWMPQTGKEENTIQFNYFRDDELINVKYRDGRKNFKMVKDAEKIPYNLDAVRTSDEMIIVEGEMDVLSVIESGHHNVISSPNGSTVHGVNLDWLDNSIEYFENKKRIILALDDDEAGQNVQKELIRRLGAENCFTVDLSPYKDFNEVLCQEGVESVKKRILEAKECPLNNVVTLNDVRNELRDFYLNGSKSGFKIGLDGFDDIFSTYTKQFIVVTGIPTHGKSDFVDQMCIGYNLKYGWKTAYCSPENKPEFLHIDKICRKYAGYRPETQIELDSLKWLKVESTVNDNFYHINFENGYSLKEVLAKAAELVKRKGIKCLVLDPFNKIHLKESKRSDVNQYTNDYLNEIDVFCKKYDVLVIVVAHPVKQIKDKGKMPEPDFYSIKGGGEWYDMSYHGLCVHRDFDRNTVSVRVMKVKFQNLGRNQANAVFMWNTNNGRYTKIIGDADSQIGEFSGDWDNSYWLKDEQKQGLITYSEPTFKEVEAAFDMTPREAPF